MLIASNDLFVLLLRLSFVSFVWRSIYSRHALFFMTFKLDWFFFVVFIFGHVGHVTLCVCVYARDCNRMNKYEFTHISLMLSAACARARVCEFACFGQLVIRHRPQKCHVPKKKTQMRLCKRPTTIAIWRTQSLHFNPNRSYRRCSMDTEHERTWFHFVRNSVHTSNSLNFNYFMIFYSQIDATTNSQILRFRKRAECLSARKMWRFMEWKAQNGVELRDTRHKNAVIHVHDTARHVFVRTNSLYVYWSYWPRKTIYDRNRVSSLVLRDSALLRTQIEKWGKACQRTTTFPYNLDKRTLWNVNYTSTLGHSFDSASDGQTYSPQLAHTHTHNCTGSRANGTL